MCIQLSVGPDDPGFGGADLPTVLELRRRLEDRAPVTQFDQFAVEGVRHVGVGQVSFEQRCHHLQARQALNPLRPGQAGMTTGACAPALPNLLHLLLPGLQGRASWGKDTRASSRWH